MSLFGSLLCFQTGLSLGFPICTTESHRSCLGPKVSSSMLEVQFYGWEQSCFSHSGHRDDLSRIRGTSAHPSLAI